jgi:8-oxo-dGTP diphosphatase
MGFEMARAPVLAAGGIVLRQEATPLIAVVRLRKRNEWVLPKGKLDDGETARAAAEREVLEETGHDVSVHEFLGTLVYESGGRFKVVHYWRMECSGEQVYELMDDVRAVDWLPLDDAVERLSRGYERAFLANVGPLALEASALGRVSQPKAKKPQVPEKRRRKPAVAPPPGVATPVPAAPDPMARPESPLEAFDAVEADVAATELASSPPSVAAEPVSAGLVEAEASAPAPRSGHGTSPARGRRANLLRMLRDWLRRAA